MSDYRSIMLFTALAGLDKRCSEHIATLYELALDHSCDPAMLDAVQEAKQIRALVCLLDSLTE